MNQASNGLEWFSSPTFILSAWLLSLVLGMILAIAVAFIPAGVERIRRFLFPLILLPAVLIVLLYAGRGFELLDRQIVHWIFRKDAIDSLRLGVLFDPVSFITSFTFFLTLTAVSIRNRTPVRITSALVLSWVGLSLVASSKTLWMAMLGLGIQMLARLLPIITARETSPETSDELWMSTTNRSWISLFMILAGGAGLASQGVHLDFSLSTSWSELSGTLATITSGALLGLGFILLLAPAFTAHVLHVGSVEPLEEENFIYESASSWSAVLILYRMMPNLADTAWALAIGIAATLLLLFSVVTGIFLESKKRSIHHWIASVPLLVLSILPFLHAQEAFLWVLGGMIAFCGTLLSFDHLQKPLERTLAGFFFLGVFGFTGWSTSAGVLEFFSRIEELPALCGGILVTWLLYASIGWRMVLRGGESGERGSPIVGWITQGILFLVGFGPLLSGRWSGGGIPDLGDSLNGSKEWPWLRGFPNDFAGTSWTGFAVGLSVLVVAILVGTFVAANAALFPFAEKYPKGKAAAKRLFGLFWVADFGSKGLTKTGEFWNGVSSGVWEKWIPTAVVGIFHALQKVGTRIESATDHLTAEKYGHLFSAPSKLVQWLHGGNVRLYAWFALVWILIFSIYLTR